jgi:hypothetical protein
LFLIRTAHEGNGFSRLSVAAAKAGVKTLKLHVPHFLRDMSRMDYEFAKIERACLGEQCAYFSSVLFEFSFVGD